MRYDYAAFALGVSIALWLMVGGTGCATSHGDIRVTLSSKHPIIEGHLAAPPSLKLSGHRLVVYVGDEVPVDTPAGEEPKPGRLINVRKAASGEQADKHFLLDLHNLLKTWKVGAEGPQVRLYGEHQTEQYGEMMQGVDFVFCFAEYYDSVVDRNEVVDLCHGGRLHDQVLRQVGSWGAGLGGKVLKAVSPF